MVPNSRAKRDSDEDDFDVSDGSDEGIDNGMSRLPCLSKAHIPIVGNVL